MRDDDIERFMTVTYLDGSRETYSFPRQSDDEYEAAMKRKFLLSTDRYILEVDGMVVMIPLTAVKRIEWSPAPDKLPDTILRGASLRDT